MKYELDIDGAAEKIEAAGAKKVLVQLPDGLKPQAADIKDGIEERTDAEVFIWLGSCFGACDIPYYVERVGIDMILQWGHSAWKEDTPEEEEDVVLDNPGGLIPW